MRELRMVHLSTATSGFEARLLAARLGAEGVVWQLRGESSLYPLGTVEVLVDEEDLDLARDLLVVADPDPEGGAALGGGDDELDDDGPMGRSHRARWASPAVLTLVALVALALMVLRAVTGV